MKKIKYIYLVVAFAIAATFYYFGTLANSAIVINESYQGVFVLPNNKGTVNNASFETSLQKFAADNHALIARRVISPNDNLGIHFEYVPYGTGTLPPNMPKASHALAENSSLFEDYLIIRGNLSSLDLQNFFTEHANFVEAIDFSPPLFNRFESAFASLSSILGLLVLILLYLGLTIFTRISELRKASIELLSGYRTLQIAFREFWRDLLFVIPLAGINFAGVSIAVLLTTHLTHLAIFTLLLYSLFLIAVCFLSFSFLVSLFFFIVLQRAKIVSLLKGKLPVRSLIAFILVLQVGVMVILALVSSNIFSFNDELHQQEAQQTTWQKQLDYYTSMTNLNQNPSDSTNWYNFFNEQIQSQNGILVYHNLNAGSFYEDSYTPKTSYGNYLVVTPNYLTQQHISLSTAEMNSLEHLSAGHYGFILPEKLSSQVQVLTAYYNKLMSSYAEISMQATSPSFVANNQQRFIYNSAYNSYSQQQEVKDPIIIVVTPQSMTKKAVAFWFGNSAYFYTLGFSQTENSLKRNHISSEVSYLQDQKQLFEANIQQLRSAITVQFVSAILSLALALFFFILIDTLYFVQFRREIFIKRLSGSAFIAIHLRFLLIQTSMVIIAWPLMYFILGNILAPTSIALFIFFISLLVLVIQNRLEVTRSVTVMKGE